MVGLHPIAQREPPSVTYRTTINIKTQQQKRIHYGKEKQRRQNDSSKKARGEGAGWERDG